ncbi:hypothetical protein J1N35_033349 [Gossypium stocksii]|uniref:Uncharacterized protein n=1 Tax=Gossypium stocksii TaxID=47602 RepID=A0A9D3ZP14_9ROSI|nr:hypothetical protein J1N35_033349 [Gossypium stocksii]
MPFLAAIRHQPYLWPLMSHVTGNWCNSNINHLPPNNKGVHGEKMPYSAPNIATLIPQWLHTEAYVWCINTRCSTSQPLCGTTSIELCDNLGVDNLCWSSHNNLLMSMAT